MPIELYHKAGFGRRIRRTTAAAVANLCKITGNFYSSIPGVPGGCNPGPAAPPPIGPGGVTIRPGTTGGQTSDIQFATGGAVLNAAAVVTIDVTEDGGTAQQFTVAVDAGDAGHDIAVKVAAAPEWGQAPLSITATVNGASCELDAGAGETIDAISATIA